MLLVLGVVGVVAGGKVLVDRFQHGAFTCLPSDFPHYPGATVSSESTYTGTKGSECRMTFDSNDPVTSVGPYYQSHLNSQAPDRGAARDPVARRARTILPPRGQRLPRPRRVP